MNLKQLMMNNREALIAAFIVLVVVGLVFAVIIPRMREDSILGHAKPATQKLMVIDQDSGAISFVNKSLQGINTDFTTRDGNVLTAMKMLLGENLNSFGGYETQYTAGDTMGIIGMLTRDQQALDTRAGAMDTRLTTAVGTKQASGNYVTKGSYFNFIAKTDERRPRDLPSLMRFHNKQWDGQYQVSLASHSGDSNARNREDAQWKII